jgi:hypothetical protein
MRVHFLQAVKDVFGSFSKRGVVATLSLLPPEVLFDLRFGTDTFAVVTNEELSDVTSPNKALAYLIREKIRSSSRTRSMRSARNFPKIFRKKRSWILAAARARSSDGRSLWVYESNRHGVFPFALQVRGEKH